MMIVQRPEIHSAADLLIDAAATGAVVAPVRDVLGTEDVEAAYAVQQLVNAARAEQGARRIGRKIGITSTAVQQQLGVDQPDFGALFDDMQHPDGSTVEIDTLLQPRIEAEVAFVLRADIIGPVTAETVKDYVAECRAALEIVDSRIAGWDISLVDTIADNASCGALVLGDESVPVAEIDLPAVVMRLDREGTPEPVSTGTGADCMGDPLAALAWLATTVAELGDPLRSGEVVLSGALGPMVTVAAGDVFRASIEGLGTVSVAFTDSRGAAPGNAE